MKLAVVTVNMGDFLCQNARQSFMRAASRWGAEYLEIDESNGVPGVHPYSQKLHALDLAGADRIFLIDADAIIRSDAPSPFDLVPPETIGAVKDINPAFSNNEEIEAIEKREWDEINHAFSKSLPMPVDYFNSGALVATARYHAPVWERAQDINKIANIDWIFSDQSQLNYAARELGVPITRLGYTWNRTRPELFGHWDGMEEYVYHFAGSGDRFTVLNWLSWHYPPKSVQPPEAIRFKANRLKAMDRSSGGKDEIVYKPGGKGTGLVLRVLAFGPYITLEPGEYELEVELEIGRRKTMSLYPPAVVLLTSDRGKRLIKAFHVRDGRAKKHSARVTLHERLLYCELVIRHDPTREISYRGFSLTRLGKAKAGETGPAARLGSGYVTDKRISLSDAAIKARERLRSIRS